METSIKKEKMISIEELLKDTQKLINNSFARKRFEITQIQILKIKKKL